MTMTMTLKTLGTRSLPTLSDHNRRALGFVLFAVPMLLTFNTSILPVVAGVGAMLLIRSLWPYEKMTWLRIASFQALALASILGLLLLSPSCAEGAMLGFMMMNVTATLLSKKPL